jgi:hypothetical protein
MLKGIRMTSLIYAMIDLRTETCSNLIHIRIMLIKYVIPCDQIRRFNITATTQQPGEAIGLGSCSVLTSAAIPTAINEVP